MKFKVGDKVRLKNSNHDSFCESMNEYVGKETSIIGSWRGAVTKATYYKVSDNSWNWVEDSLELVESKSEPKEYFYVGQTVYSPLFQNKERKAIIAKIDKNMDYPVLCEGEGIWNLFTLDGRYKESEDFISLFQEPIQFPVNKPIERFEEGEIVECSNNNEFWGLGYFVGFGDNSARPYKVCTVKDDKKESDSVLDYAKIRKIR